MSSVRSLLAFVTEDAGAGAHSCSLGHALLSFLSWSSHSLFTQLQSLWYGMTPSLQFFPWISFSNFTWPLEGGCHWDPHFLEDVSEAGRS